jgi:hypothetical protein
VIGWRSRAGRFYVQKSKIEFSIVYYERVHTNKGQKLVGNDREWGLTKQNRRRSRANLRPRSRSAVGG